MTARAEDRELPEPSPGAAIVKSRQELLSKRVAQLIDLFLAESDPATWPGTDTAADRGDRFWLKRNAEATGRVAKRALDLLKPEVTMGAEATQEEIDYENERIKQEAQRLERVGAAIVERWKADKESRTGEKCQDDMTPEAIATGRTQAVSAARRRPRPRGDRDVRPAHRYGDVVLIGSIPKGRDAELHQAPAPARLVYAG